MPKTLGSWTVGARIGQGGQGRVFRATRVGSEADSEVFALKRLSNAGSPKARARFTREIDALKRISHPGVRAVQKKGGSGKPLAFVNREVASIGDGLCQDGSRQLLQRIEPDDERCF